MEPKMTISFIGKKARVTKHKLLPLYLRVIIEGKRFEVATHQHVKFAEWSNASGRLKGRSDSAISVNMALDEIRRKVYELRDRILVEGKKPDIFSNHNDQLFTLIGVDCSKATWVKYRTTYEHTKAFINWQGSMPGTIRKGSVKYL